MSHPIAYINGSWIPSNELVVGADDLGFTGGVVVAEQLRTYAHRAHLIDAHLSRFQRGLELTGIKLSESKTDLQQRVADIVERNRMLTRSELGISLFATPGRGRIGVPRSSDATPTLGLQTYELDESKHEQARARGIALTVVATREIPGTCVPKPIKHRSRMHYWMAEREAQQVDRTSRALLLDQNGYIAECASANIAFYFPDEGLVAPREEMILPGVTFAHACRLSADSIPWVRRDIGPEEVPRCREMFWFSTPTGILPVCRLDGNDVGSGRPGQIYQKLHTLWLASALDP